MTSRSSGTKPHHHSSITIPTVMKSSSYGLCLVVSTTLVSITWSHSFLTSPAPYFHRVKETDGCIGTECTNACPTLHATSSISSTSPAATWSRAETLNLTWARNNHHGGFASFSMVPARHIHNVTMHNRFTLFHTCWEAGEHRCAPYEDCGTDQARLAYQSTMKVPSVFPDGIYALRFVWYGGLHFKRHHGHFADYASCSFIRVHGGGQVTSAPFSPFFTPGHGRHIRRGKCEASADAIGQCGNAPCVNRTMFTAIPRRFSYRGENVPYCDADLRPLMRPRPVAAGSTEAEPDAICKQNVCCPASCGQCGGRRCVYRPGGGKECCMSPIRRYGRPCHLGPPPCVITDGST